MKILNEIVLTSVYSSSFRTFFLGFGFINAASCSFIAATAFSPTFCKAIPSKIKLFLQFWCVCISNVVDAEFRLGNPFAPKHALRRPPSV